MSHSLSTQKEGITTPFDFVDGCLYIKKSNTEMVVTSWDEPSAKQRTNLSPIWESFFPDFRLVQPLRKQPSSADKPGNLQLTFDFYNDAIHHHPPIQTESKQEMRNRSFNAFRQSLPTEVADVIEPFRTRQWPLLVMCYHDKAASDLLKLNPGLGFFLAQHLNCDVEEIRSLECSQKRQRDILSLLGCPGTQANVRLMGKLHPSVITTENWTTIRDQMLGELQKEKSPLNHVSSINAGVLDIVSDPVIAAATGNNLLEEVATDHREKYRGRVVHMIRSALEMQEELQVKKKISHFSNIKRLFDVHDAVTSRYRRRVSQLNAAQLAATYNEKFSPPPIPGVPGAIEPITTPKELVDEGEDQSNCVASYARKIAKGELYIYRVMGPERATLAIVNRNEKWEIGELEGKYNSSASKETEKFVSRWLEQQ